MNTEGLKQITTQLLPRQELCQRLGFLSPETLHQFIVDAVELDVAELVRRGLTAEVLLQLGYTFDGMRKLRYKEDALARLGYGNGKAPAGIPEYDLRSLQTSYKKSSRKRRQTFQKEYGVIRLQELRELVRLGKRAEDLKAHGYNLLHCRNAGFSARELLKIGFEIQELVNVFELEELKRAGCMMYELLEYFTEQQLLSAGFSRAEMLLAETSA